MRRAILLLVALAMLAGAVRAGASTVTVTVGPDKSFHEASTTVNVGDTVRWAWDTMNTIPHTTTSGVPGSPDGVWDSPTMTSGSFDHTFTSPGTYYYYCKVHPTQMTGTVTVLAPGSDTPVARFTASPTSPKVGQAVTFDGSASGDADGDAIASYSWSFDGGGPVVTSAPQVMHSFPTPGAHSVSLTVTDSKGNPSAAVRQSFNVAAATAPKLTNARVKPKAFCRKKTATCKHPGARIRFGLDMSAKVNLVVTKKSQTTALLRRTLDGKAGKNSFPFRGKGLGPGRYVMTLTASKAGASSNPVTVRFEIRKN